MCREQAARLPAKPGCLGEGHVNRTRIGLMVLAFGLLAAFFLWSGRQPGVDDHRVFRQLMLHFTLSRFDDPIIVLGDSITEASTLPRFLCGHAVINAGLSGATTASDLGDWLSGALAGKRAALIVVALGTNDVLAQRTQQAYEVNYGKLLAQLSTMASYVVVMAIPAIEARGRVTVEMRNELMRSIDNFNAILPSLAGNGAATFVALPPMPDPHTIDGVHLNAAGYSVWDAAALQGAASACNPH
jgi:lysophospholipase L1-like esterase